MYSKHDISNLKKMTVAERKAEAMRKLKASFDQASREGSLKSRQIKTE